MTKLQKPAAFKSQGTHCSSQLHLHTTEEFGMKNPKQNFNYSIY